jgi:hypothetical protein
MKKLSVVLAIALVVGMVSVAGAGGRGYGMGPRGGPGKGVCDGTGRGMGSGICKVATPGAQTKLIASGRMGRGYGPQRQCPRNW